jgi:L-asparaginase / beta-aspartyl-peptidase
MAERKFAIVIHGGAGPDSDFIIQNMAKYEEGLAHARDAGYRILEKGGSAVDAVEAAINSLEDNPLFNAGRGSSLTAAGNIEMCTSIMRGEDRKAGAAAIIRNIKNPISFAKKLLDSSTLMYVGGEEAIAMAKDLGMEIEPDSYFVTNHQVDVFMKAREARKGAFKKTFHRAHERLHGTVGAVAVDKHGNVAAGTSTGGTDFAQPGRIGDSSMIGVGTYADNATAAVSCTGDGEYLIVEALSRAITAMMECTGCTVQHAMDRIIHEKHGGSKGDMGAIGVDAEGNIGIAFNSDRMHRAWKISDGEAVIRIYK